MNAIFAVPLLLMWALGYLVLLIATLNVVCKALAARRRIPAAARTRWLSGAAMTLLTCSLGVTCVIAFWLGFSEQNVDDLRESQLVGTWWSTAPDAPGRLTFTDEGEVETYNLTLFDNDAYWDRGALVELVEGLDANGAWDTLGNNLQIDLDSDGDEIRTVLLVTSSAFGGLTLQAITGDPDGPAFTQVFKKSS